MKISYQLRIVCHHQQIDASQKRFTNFTTEMLNVLWNIYKFFFQIVARTDAEFNRIFYKGLEQCS